VAVPALARLEQHRLGQLVEQLGGLPRVVAGEPEILYTRERREVAALRMAHLAAGRRE
jgi:hypothetical protein